MACFDTSVLLDLMGRGGRRGITRASKRIHQVVDGGQDLTTTCFNVAELLVGVHRSNDPDRERAYQEISGAQPDRKKAQVAGVLIGLSSPAEEDLR